MAHSEPAHGAHGGLTPDQLSVLAEIARSGYRLGAGADSMIIPVLVTRGLVRWNWHGWEVTATGRDMLIRAGAFLAAGCGRDVAVLGRLVPGWLAARAAGSRLAGPGVLFICDPCNRGCHGEPGAGCPDSRCQCTCKPPPA